MAGTGPSTLLSLSKDDRIAAFQLPVQNAAAHDAQVLYYTLVAMPMYFMPTGQVQNVQQRPVPHSSHVTRQQSVGSLQVPFQFLPNFLLTPA